MTPASTRAPWDDWIRRLAAAPGQEVLRAVLLSIAGETRARLADRGSLAARWRPVGVEVRAALLGASGGAAARRSRRTVLVARSEPSRRRAYTIAHEVAHLLLAEARPGAAWALGRAAEERLCEEYASHVLIDRVRLRKQLALHGAPSDPVDLIELCDRFGVNLQPMFPALRPFMLDASVALVASRMRGHPERTHEVAFRVDASVGHRRLFIPRHKRLRSLGLQSLAATARDMEQGERASGVDWAELPARRAAEAVALAEIPWRAMLLGTPTSPLMLVALDVTEALAPPTRAPSALAA